MDVTPRYESERVARHDIRRHEGQQVGSGLPILEFLTVDSHGLGDEDGIHHRRDWTNEPEDQSGARNGTVAYRKDWSGHDGPNGHRHNAYTWHSRLIWATVRMKRSK
jgi:hypothetical protein